MKQETSSELKVGAGSPTVDMASPLAKMDQRIGSFAVFDLETNNLPVEWSKIAITEMSVYAFAAKELDVEPLVAPSKPPARPRILHKLTLLFNPRQLIHPEAEQLTGLNNYILEEESYFNENAANTVINFLQHLRQPVCLVAHNGSRFDFPIVKHTFNKLSMQLPQSLLCVDSLRAFLGIDEQLALQCSPTTDMFTTKMTTATAAEQVDEKAMKATDTIVTTKLPQKEISTLTDNKRDETSRRVQNETTPKRPTITAEAKSVLRAQMAHGGSSETTPVKNCQIDAPLKSRRALFQSPGTRKHPPRHVYRLGNIYERLFERKPEQVHHAEGDVDTLMKLMQAYGRNFLAYAENHAISFTEVPDRV